LLGKLGGVLKNTAGKLTTSISNKLSTAFSPITSTLSALDPTLKRNVGEDDKYGWKKSRPELSENSVVEQISTANKQYQDHVKDYYLESGDKTTPFIKYFTSNIGVSSLADGIVKDGDPTSIRISLGDAAEGYARKLSYIKDPSNTQLSRKNDSVALPYSRINSNFDDPVTVSFAMGKESPVKFRAFIKDLVENNMPQYTPYQYVGRVEKFINYTGVQRDISFKLAILAFGPSELDVVWRRINYLTGLTFPYGFTNGIMQPNIVRLTIGGVYTNQPGYITALSTNFNEPAGSWDIEKDVPIGATVDIKFTLIEKATRIAQSPFYGITDGDGRANKYPMPGFSKTIPVPKSITTAANPKKDPPASENSSDVELVDNRTIAEQISAGVPLDESGRPIINP
jgi:hypothetical protein